MLFNIINVSISSPVLGCCHCTHLKGCLLKEKEEIRERDDKNGIERDGKGVWKNLLPYRLLWLVRKHLSPSSLEEAKTVSRTEKAREIFLFAHSHHFCPSDNPAILN